jgi:hypothetical protein
MPHLTTAEVAEVCRVYGEELHLDAAVYLAQARASKRIAEIMRAANAPTTQDALDILAARSDQGDAHAAEMLEELMQALTVATMPDD